MCSKLLFELGGDYEGEKGLYFLCYNVPISCQIPCILELPSPCRSFFRDETINGKADRSLVSKISSKLSKLEIPSNRFGTGDSALGSFSPKGQSSKPRILRHIDSPHPSSVDLLGEHSFDCPQKIDKKLGRALSTHEVIARSAGDRRQAHILGAFATSMPSAISSSPVHKSQHVSLTIPDLPRKLDHHTRSASSLPINARYSFTPPSNANRTTWGRGE
jgi:hypothetical protein